MKTNECAGEGNKITIVREEKKIIEEKIDVTIWYTLGTLVTPRLAIFLRK